MNPCCEINEVIREHYGALLAYSLKRVGDYHTAEDVVQEVMYRAAKVHAGGSEVHNVKAWLYQTTRHVIADHFRDQAKAQKTVSGFIHSSQLTTDEPAVMPFDGLVPLIRLLPAEYAMPLLWSDIENIPQREIAQRLGITLSAAKMRIQRARKKLHAVFIACCEITYDRKGNFVDCSIKAGCDPLLRIEADLRSQMNR